MPQAGGIGVVDHQLHKSGWRIEIAAAAGGWGSPYVWTTISIRLSRHAGSTAFSTSPATSLRDAESDGEHRRFALGTLPHGRRCFSRPHTERPIVQNTVPTPTRLGYLVSANAFQGERTHSWPVFLITKRMLCLIAKAIPFETSKG